MNEILKLYKYPTTMYKWYHMQVFFDIDVAKDIKISIFLHNPSKGKGSKIILHFEKILDLFDQIKVSSLNHNRSIDLTTSSKI